MPYDIGVESQVLPKLVFEGEDESLEVREYIVTERIQECFELRVSARSKDYDLKFDDFVNKAAGLGVATRWGPIGWTGVCSHMEMSQVDKSDPGLTTYHLTIVPAMWLLGQRRGYRIFQHLTTQEIVDKILGEYQIEATFDLKEAHPVFEYRVQFGETDLAFVRRLLEEDGISFYFAQESTTQTKGFFKKTKFFEVETKLHFCDQPHKNPSLGAISFHDEPNDAQRRKPFVSNLRIAHNVRPGRAAFRDYDLRRPKHALLKEKEAPLAEPSKEKDYEHYLYLPGSSIIDVASATDKLPVADDKSTARHDDTHLQRRVDRYLEASRHGKYEVSLDTNEGRLIPGTVFEIINHPHPDTQKKMLVVETLLQANIGGWNLGVLATFVDEPFRPELVTEKPRAAGIQTAIVVGPPGQEIYVDELGRVRVRFHWDREAKWDDNATCWLRVSQGWAGVRFGMMLVPRIGQEVIVDFLEGDPDMPLVVGRVFNATTKVPRELPKHKTQSIWRSATSPHTDGRFNEIMFEDEKQKELLFWQSQRDTQRLTKNDETERTGRDRVAIVGEGRVAAVARHDYLQVGQQHLVKMVKAGDLKIPAMGDPKVTERDTFLEVKNERISLTTGDATILLEGPDITILAKKGIRFTASKYLVIEGGPNIYLNCKPVDAKAQATKPVRDVVPKPDRMLGSIEKLFWEEPKKEILERKNIKANLESFDFSPAPAAQSCADLWKDVEDQAAAIIEPVDGDHTKRNHVITGAWSDLYLHDPNMAWAGMAAYASKQVGCGMADAAATPKWALGARQGANYTYEKLGDGNRGVFLDSYPVHKFYQNHGLAKLKECKNERTTPYPISDPQLKGFEAIERYKQTGDKQYLDKSAVLLLEHEQVHFLQDRVYGEWRMKRIMDTQRYLGGKVPGIPPMQLTLAPECDGAGDRTIPFTEGDLYDVEDRMEWINGKLVPKYSNDILGTPTHRSDLELLRDKGADLGGVYPGGG